jgi:hypothetical protein
MGCGFNEIGPCPGRCGVTGGGRFPLVVVHLPGRLATWLFWLGGNGP